MWTSSIVYILILMKVEMLPTNKIWWDGVKMWYLWAWIRWRTYSLRSNADKEYLDLINSTTIVNQSNANMIFQPFSRQKFDTTSWYDPWLHICSTPLPCVENSIVWQGETIHIPHLVNKIRTRFFLNSHPDLHVNFAGQFVTIFPPKVLPTKPPFI